MNNRYALVLFLVVITSTSSVSCAYSNKDQEIFMVVDDQTSTMQPGMGITKADNSVQIGRFQLEEGKLVTLSRPMNSRENQCITPGQPCGLLDWCCEGLACDGAFDGRCQIQSYCRAAGSFCSMTTEPCCYPHSCSWPYQGTCKCCCPCNTCNNVKWGTLAELERHIRSRGSCKTYKTWIFHGEHFAPARLQPIPQTTCEMRDALNDVVLENTSNEHHIDNEENSNEPIEGPSSTNDNLDELFTLADTPLYPGCDWMSSLDFVAKISHMKAMNHWTDTSFDQLPELLRFAFPKDKKLPKSHYESKKLMKKVGLGYESIHACKNDYCLFWKDYKDMESCPICH